MTETATAAEAAASKEAPHEHPVKWGWILAQGIVTLILGTIAFYFATVATLATVYMFGGLMGAAGIIQIAESIADEDHKWSQRLTNALIGIVYIVTSMLIFIDPLAASVALTILIAALFIAIGVIRIVTAWRNRSKGWSWLWLALFGLVNIAFGLFVTFTLPVSALWLIGLMVSIEMIMHGWILVVAALAARKAQTVN